MRRARWLGLAAALAAAAIARGGLPPIAQAAAPPIGQAAPGGILWGVNESGMDMGHGNIAGTNFAIPDPAYYLAHGVQLVRVPFRMDRLQPQPNGPLDPALVQDLKKIIAQDQAAGAITVLDPHGYAFFNVDGKPLDILQDPQAAALYIDFMQRLATAFATDDVAIGLMNEPHTGSDVDYAKIWNRAILAIRQAGYHGVILVPHAHWGTANDIRPASPYQGQIEDPDHNWVLEIHSYLDPDGTGTYKQPVASADIGAQRLAGAIAWARQAHVRLFLGETGAPADPLAVTALSNMFNALSAAPDVVWGVAVWGGGAWWSPHYPMRLDPINGVDQPQFIALENVMTPEILYLAKDPGADDVSVNIALGKRDIAKVTVAASSLEAPQRIPLRAAFRPGNDRVTIVPAQPGGRVYFMGSTWQGRPNSDSPVTPVPAQGTSVQIRIPAP